MIIAGGKKCHTEERERVVYLFEEKKPILIRKASSNIIFHSSPFPLYCLKYSLVIKN